MKRKIFMMVLITLSLIVKSQSVVKYERHVDDGHVWHNCINAFEASDGNIIMMEECCDTIGDYSGVYTESVNLLKINPQGVLVDSAKVDFSATSFDSPFFRVPSETNNNVLGGLYLNENNELRYTAIFFDDDLSVKNDIDVAFSVEGFTTSYKSIIDSNNDLILMSKDNGSDDTYIFVKMDIYGEIKTVKHSVSENYKDCYLTENSLYVHGNNPLEYGCYFLDGAGNTTITSVILDENFEILNFVDVKNYEEDNQTYIFDCTESEFMCLNDGNILMSSVVYEKEGMNDELTEYIQLTKFNKEYEVVAYGRVASRLIFGDENSFYVNSSKSIVEDANGNIYMIWINTDGKNIVSYLNNKLELIWETALDMTGANQTLLYDAFVMDGNKLVVYGDYVRYDVGYFGVCYIISNNNVISVPENSTNNFSIYPNPVNDVINLSFSSDVNCEKIEIYGIDGKLYHEQNFNVESVNVSNLSNGIYMVKVTLDNGNTYTEKIVKE